MRMSERQVRRLESDFLKRKLRGKCPVCGAPFFVQSYAITGSRAGTDVSQMHLFCKNQHEFSLVPKDAGSAALEDALNHL